VYLTKPDMDFLENSMGFGLSANYNFRPYIQFRLPLLYSSHDGKDLPEGTTADLSMTAITPGIAFSTTGRAQWWFFVGAGVNFLSNKYENGLVEVKEEETAVAYRLGAGLDLRIFRGLSVGVGGAVLAASYDALQGNGTKEYDTYTYYTVLGRLSYTF
jgi:hypothetical protein